MFSADLGVTPSSANYIEDVFSTYLYTGNSTTGGTQTITNGVDLSTKGGMVWIKGRSTVSVPNHVLFDTARGAGTTASNNQALSSNLTTAEDLAASYDFLSAFNTDGFTVTQGGTGSATRGANYLDEPYVSWTFRKQAKFFDIVTYTGDGTTPRNISHNLGSVPGCIIIKNLTTAQTWPVYHRSLNIAGGFALRLNTTDASVNTGVLPQFFASTVATSTQFTVGNAGATNESGSTFVAYLFAHDAGGFGASGTDNVISCGSYTGTGAAGNFVSLGYEPQWVLIKRSDTAAGWALFDSMRGIVTGTNGDIYLLPNSNGGDGPNYTFIAANATGFTLEGITSATNYSGGTYIYIAIRRGPMKTPTTGTSVFQPNARTGTGVANTINTNFTVDLEITKSRNAVDYNLWATRLTGVQSLISDTTNAETDFGWWTAPKPWDIQNGFYMNQFASMNGSGTTYVDYFFRRAPGFFDVVCYTGTGSATTFSHNLGVAPELMIVKDRVAATNWVVYSSATGATKYLLLNQTSAAATATAVWNDTAPTSSVFTVGTSGSTNNAADTFVAYLFATVAGVSKVGSYTGTGTTKQIDCGFTGGARFVLIKRTDSTGDWYYWDTARGIVAGNDPYLLFNSAAAEVTGTDYVDTYSAGFEISSTAPAAINANGGTFIFLAIA